LALVLGCGSKSAADSDTTTAGSEATDTGSSESSEDGEPGVPCGGDVFGCISENNSGSTELECELDCELDSPCPTSPVTAFGASADTATGACIVDGLRMTEGPVHFEYGIAEETDQMHEYYLTTQWDLWVVDDDQAVLRSVTRWTELGGSWARASIVGGALPEREAFDACVDPSEGTMWDCVIDLIDWCEGGSIVGPTDDQPWCPS
jgi:hypothetical protein